MSLLQIYEGWKNHLIPSKNLKDIIKNVSEERLEICNACDSHSKNYKKNRPDDHCTKCGCTLLAKTKCLSCNCPINKWTAVLTSDQEEEIKNIDGKE